jgi:hypothetical protein
MADAFDRAAAVAAARQWSRAARRRLSVELDAIARAPRIEVKPEPRDAAGGQAEFPFTQ